MEKGGFNVLADEEGFVVVYPDAVDNQWNDGRSKEEADHRAHEENIDDVGFISALIDQLIKEENVDPQRVVGKTSQEINANEVIWNFFKKHVRQ